MRLIFLDTTPLGLLAHPKGNQDATDCKRWVDELLSDEVRVVVPGIADYEVRRELIRAGKTVGLERLDAIRDLLEFSPITQAVLDFAAEIWADVRKRGMPTADRAALDVDCILAAQAILAADQDDIVTVATSNVAHSARFVDARDWRSIAR